jgi:hypothetical protein
MSTQRIPRYGSPNQPNADMDFSPDFASYEAVTETNFSPTDELFTYPVAVDESHLPEPYTMSPAASFYDRDSYFTLPFSAMENDTVSPGEHEHAQAGRPIPPATASTAAYFPPRPPPSPTFHSTSLGQLEPSVSVFSFGTSLSPRSQHYRSPSISDENPQQLHPSNSQDQSGCPSLKREPSVEDATSNTRLPSCLRKRGRPRLSQTNNMTSTSTVSTDNSSSTKSRRQPHNQVERKYRENLNAELERLRLAIPAVPLKSAVDGGVVAQPKPSKAMVLAGAIEYIERLEMERNEYKAECERLRGLVG